MTSAIFPYRSGITAAPQIAITIIEEPTFVKRPRPLIASGQIEGHISEFARPNKATNITEVKPFVMRATKANITPRTEEMIRARFCEKYFGIPIIPITYPTSIAKIVKDEKNLAVEIGI